MMRFGIRYGCRSSYTLERRRSSLFAGILFPLINLLFELLRLFLVDEREPRQAFLELERMEERSVLVVIEWIVDLLVPDDA